MHRISNPMGLLQEEADTHSNQKDEEIFSESNFVADDRSQGFESLSEKLVFPLTNPLPCGIIQT